MATAMVAAACGGSSGSKTASSASATTIPASLTAFVNCLKSHGYTPPPGFLQRRGANAGNDNGAPPSTTPGATRPTMTPVQRQAQQEAFQACRSLAPAGGFGFGGGGARFLSQLRAYASCLSDHGYTKLQAALPPPTTAGPTSSATSGQAAGAGQRLRQVLSAIDRNDPAFVSANQSCQALAPNLNGPGTGTTTTATSG
jgi:hypothetical protein